jgi:hypothetical protein
VADYGEVGGVGKCDAYGWVCLSVDGRMSFIAARVHLVSKTSNARLGHFKMAKGNPKGEVSQNAFGTGG